jgi:hypothetical protein
MRLIAVVVFIVYAIVFSFAYFPLIIVLGTKKIEPLSKPFYWCAKKME